MSENLKDPDLLGITAEIVAAHVSNNAVSMSDLPSLITEVHRTLSTLGTPAAAPDAVVRKEPAVAIKKSVTPDYLFCLEDGKKLKMLKRHLRTSYGMSPAQYREKWSLPSDYPMVAPTYAQRRSALAKEIGLGTARATAAKPGRKKS